MCGIAFLLDRRIPATLGTQCMQLCLGSLQHRGPDDSNIKVSGNAILGHRRLSIIDVSGSRQPMTDPTDRYSLAYNGEIYNYAEVRKSLGERWRFTTQGDTEVLLAGLILEGANFLARLEGMWAFVFWDSHASSLLLGRDRMGKKPLYFVTLPGGGLACASELPALRKLSDEAWSEDEKSTADYLRYGFTMPGYTAWRNVHEILPGHIANWQPDGELQQTAWWQLKANIFTGNQEQAASLLQEYLVTAVERRLVADVEVGAFLSGGIDSSLICAIVRKSLDRPLKTFTIGFEDADFDERRYANIAARELGTDHYEEVLANWNESELEHLLLNHVGQPFADASLLPTALVSHVAAKRVKVALSGDGGDELFSGYQRYQARNILRWYSRLPKGLQHLAEKAVRILPEPTAHHSRSIIKKAHLFMDIVGRQKAETPYFAPLMFTPQQIQKLAPGLENMGHTPPGIPEQTMPDDISRMMFADALIYLPQDVLVKVDRASMAYSLEARAPFLDSQVVELAFSMPRNWHRHSLAGKRMLYKTFSSMLPGTLWRRRKQGFGVPIHQWFRDGLELKLRGLLSESLNPFNGTAVELLIDAHNKGGRDHGYRLWMIYIYLLWKYQYT